MVVDFKKTLKHLYAPKTKPSIVNIENANYIVVRGSGDPNDDNSEYKGLPPKVLKFDKVHMRTHRCSGLLISNFALEKLFRYLINCAGVTRQNRFLRNHDF